MPIIDLLSAYFKIDDRDDHREIREKVTGKLITLDESLRPLLPALLTLIDVTIADGEWPTLDHAQHRQQTLDAVRDLLVRESQVQPLLLVIEDRHWAPPKPQPSLDTLIEAFPTARILVVVDFRPEYRHGWGGKPYYTELKIDPPSPARARQRRSPPF